MDSNPCPIHVATQAKMGLDAVNRLFLLSGDGEVNASVSARVSDKNICGKLL